MNYFKGKQFKKDVIIVFCWLLPALQSKLSLSSGIVI